MKVRIKSVEGMGAKNVLKYIGQVGTVVSMGRRKKHFDVQVEMPDGERWWFKRHEVERIDGEPLGRMQGRGAS